METPRSRKILPAVLLVLFALAAVVFAFRHYRASRASVVEAVEYSEIRASDSLSAGARALIQDTLPGAAAPAADTARPRIEGPVVRVRLSETIAPTADPAAPPLRVAIELSIAGGQAAARELKEREAGLIRLVRFVLSRQAPAQVRSDSCRLALLERFNAYLSAGRAVELRFITLEPVASGGAP